VVNQSAETLLRDRSRLVTELRQLEAMTPGVIWCFRSCWAHPPETWVLRMCQPRRIRLTASGCRVTVAAHIYAPIVQ